MCDHSRQPARLRETLSLESGAGCMNESPELKVVPWLDGDDELTSVLPSLGSSLGLHCVPCCRTSIEHRTNHSSTSLTSAFAKFPRVWSFLLHLLFCHRHSAQLLLFTPFHIFHPPPQLFLQLLRLLHRRSIVASPNPFPRNLINPRHHG